MDVRIKDLTRNEMLALMEMAEKTGPVTKNDLKAYMSSLTWYFITSSLSKKGLIENNGVRRQFKVWRLTERGKKVALLLKEIEKVLA